VTLPMYLGVTKMSTKYGCVISTDIITLTGDEVLPPCDEIMKARKK